MKQSVRLDKIPPYLFAELDKKIEKAKAKGYKLINLGVGDPDFSTYEEIISEMHNAIDTPNNYSYPPYNGTKTFREASCEWMKERFDVDIDSDSEMLINIGSKEAIAHTFFAYVDEGDYTLIPDPGYPVYKNATVFAGGIPYSMPLLPENNFLPDFDKIPEEIAQKSKLMFLNYPSNPTGAVCDIDFFQKAVNFCKKYDILLCHDQAYCEMTFDNYIAPSVLQAEGAKDIAIEFFSHSKSYNMTGWRIGFVCGNKNAIKALGTIKNNIDSGAFKAIQQAAVTAFKTPKEKIQKINNIYKERKELMANGLQELGWNIKPTKATFYMWIPVPKDFSSEEFVNLLFEKTQIVVPSGSGYGKYGEGYIRIALTRPQEEIKEALNRMKNAGIRYNMTKK